MLLYHPQLPYVDHFFEFYRIIHLNQRVDLAAAL
jgi:hypothetical protein